MLIELRDVEVHVEPLEVLTKALEEGDATVDSVVNECIINDGAESVLDGVDNGDIQRYCERYQLQEHLDYHAVADLAKKLNQVEKAMLVWLLLSTTKEES